MKITSPPQLDRALAGGPLLPVYLLSCDEPLTAGEAADARRAAARKQGYADREVYFFERTAPWDEILSSAQAMSLFSSRKIIELRMPGGKPGHGAKTLLEVIRAAGQDVLLLILTEKLDFASQKAEWVGAAEKAGAWIDLPTVEAAKFPDWIRARAKRAGLRHDLYRAAGRQRRLGVARRRLSGTFFHQPALVAAAKRAHHQRRQ